MNNIKRILIIMFITVILLTAVVNVVSASGVEEFYLKITAEEPDSEYINVAINVNEADDIGSLNLDLIYDPTIIIAENVILGKTASGSLFAYTIKNDAGKVSLGYATTKGISGTGPLSVIKFKIVGEKEDITPLTISVTTLTDTDVNSMKKPKITNSEFIVGSDITIEKPEKEAPTQKVDMPESQSTPSGDDIKNGTSSPGFGMMMAIAIVSIICLLRKYGK